MSDLSFDKALDLLEILLANGVHEIDIMGGEPTLLGWIPDFAFAAVNKNISVNISTNGSNTTVIRKFNGIDPSKITIGISLEGSTAERQNSITNSTSFNTALESIKTLISMKMDPVVKTVINRRTMPDIQGIIELIRSLGVRRSFLIHMDLLSKDGILKEEAMGYTEFLAFYNKIRVDNPDMGIFKVNASCFDKGSLPDGARCAGGVRKLAIMPDGSVFPCNLFQAFEEFNLGNIFGDDFSSIWTSPKLALFREFQRCGCDSKICENRGLCTGGCPAHGFYHNEDTEGRDIRCAVK